MTAFRPKQLRNVRRNMVRSVRQIGVAALAAAVVFAATAADVHGQVRGMGGRGFTPMRPFMPMNSSMNMMHMQQNQTRMTTNPNRLTAAHRAAILPHRLPHEER